MDYLVYENKKAWWNCTPTIIKIPYWKATHHHYQELLTVCQLRIADYPFEYGPYPSPLSWVSYMDSIFELTFIYPQHI